MDYVCVDCAPDAEGKCDGATQEDADCAAPGGFGDIKAEMVRDGGVFRNGGGRLGPSLVGHGVR